MSILLPALAVAFAAFCVWLGVRIVNRRERWAKWALAGVVGVPVLYIASFGPAIRSATRSELPLETVVRIYRPLFSLTSKSDIARNAMNWYAGVWTDGSVRFN